MKFIQGSNSTNPLLFPQCCDILRLHDSGTNWHNIEATKRQYAWSNLDYYLATCQSKGIELMYTISGIPRWAALAGFEPDSTTQGAQGPQSNFPPDPAEYSYWLDVLFTHVGNQIKYWEVKNEWNAPGYWVGTDAQLLELAQITYTKAKQVNPDAKVLIPTPCLQEWKNQTVSQALEYLFQLGFQQYADVISFHGYLPPSVDSNQISPELDTIHYHMTRHGIDLPVMDTESGYMCTDYIPDCDKQAWIENWVNIRLYKGVTAGWYQWNNLTSYEWGAPMVNADGTLTVGGTAMVSFYNSFHSAE